MRNVPDDNLAYPVLLTFDTGSSGSSFLLNTGEKMFLVTAKHVLFDEKNNIRGKNIVLICQTRNLMDKNTTKYSIDLEKVIVLKHENADVGVIEIGIVKQTEQKGAYYVEHHEGVRILENDKSGTVSVDAQSSTKLLRDVLVSNDVFLYGYPTSLGLKDTPQFDYSMPLLRKGIIANIYPDQGTIVLDCPVYYGNSGGPVIEVEQVELNFNHRVIGVVSQFIPFIEQWVNKQNGLTNMELSNSGYSVAVAMDKVFELIHFSKE